MDWDYEDKVPWQKTQHTHNQMPTSLEFEPATYWPNTLWPLNHVPHYIKDAINKYRFSPETALIYNKHFIKF